MSGRKSIAQMTSTQTVVMISIGTIIVQLSLNLYDCSSLYGMASSEV
ncbi:hypothetical protein M0696_03095 [Bacillus rugosus]|uniref:Uncharacterized protein n=1 Tax=Bacillus rugosus TaxID=2715209 RepID=A0ACD4A0M4_9BACI|nr:MULTISPECIES: hypothetical protein [Bacillus]UPV79741.1 hypothetical protein M0696_03095 [Bacillus rugosus]